MNHLPAESLAAIQNAASLIRRAKKTVILTGAGYSTPSGIPDFRTAGSGLWTKYLPMEVASLTTFRTNPELFFAWMHPLASHMLGALPNDAHLALAKLEASGYLSTIITQNIDGLHHRAGNKHVLEIHGTFNTLTCVGCFKKFASDGLIQPYLDNGEIPHCPECHRLLKPDVILFEEQLPVRTWTKAEKACESCDLMLVAGTSLEVMPSARLPVRALDNGAGLILVNKTETFIDVRADIILRGDVAELMPLLVDEVLGG
jgi:NAD-dependent deacetylase